MKNKFLIALGVALTVCITTPTFAQVSTSPKTEVVASKVKAENLTKFQLPAVDVPAPKPDPNTTTSSTTTRCCITFDNYTGYTLNIWVDGTFRGTVSAWSDGSVCVPKGWTSYYVRTTGGTYEWSGSGDCSGSYRLKID